MQGQAEVGLWLWVYSSTSNIYLLLYYLFVFQLENVIMYLKKPHVSYSMVCVCVCAQELGRRLGLHAFRQSPRLCGQPWQPAGTRCWRRVHPYLLGPQVGTEFSICSPPTFSQYWKHCFLWPWHRFVTSDSTKWEWHLCSPIPMGSHVSCQASGGRGISRMEE